MKYTEDRIKHLAFTIHDRLYMDEVVDYTDETAALSLIKKTLHDCLSLEEKIDSLVTAKIRSLKKGVLQHSDEWNILYPKYFEEELCKHFR